jgi:hypothetical protein
VACRDLLYPRPTIEGHRNNNGDKAQIEYTPNCWPIPEDASYSVPSNDHRLDKHACSERGENCQQGTSHLASVKAAYTFDQWSPTKLIAKVTHHR